MKSINEYLLDTPLAQSDKTQVNEFVVTGALVGSVLLGFGLFNLLGGTSGIKDKGSKAGGFFSKLFSRKSPEERRKEEEEIKKHELEMVKLQKEIDKLSIDGDDWRKEEIADKKHKLEIEKLTNELEQVKQKKNEAEEKKKKSDKENSTVPETSKLMAAAKKEVDNVSDPVEQQKLQRQLSIMQCAQVDENGNPRSAADQKKWLEENLSEKDLDGFKKAAFKVGEDVEIDEKMLKELNSKVDGVTDEESVKALADAKKKRDDLGVKMEADAKVRKEKEDAIALKEQDFKNQMADFDKKIAEAGTDKEVVKKLKKEKAEAAKTAATDIYNSKSDLIDFNKISESGKMLNVVIPDRKKNLEEQESELKAAYETQMKQLDQEIAKNGGDPEEKGNETTTTPAPKKDDEEEVHPHLDEDGDPDGSYIVKKAKDKDGNTKYVMRDDKGEEVEISKEEFESEKKRSQEFEEESNGDDEKGDDIETKVQNPAKIWHKKKNKSTGKPTKSYYNKKGDSISAKEFKEKMEAYKKVASKQKNESFSEFLKHNIDECKYDSLKNALLEKLD